MSELGKYNTSNALGIATKAINAVGTGNYTGITNTLTNSLVNQIQGQALKNGNGTVVGYVMTELNNLGYVKGTLSGGNIQTASFAGTLANAAQTLVKSPVSFATSLAGNYIGSVAGIDTSQLVNNVKSAFSGASVSDPASIGNGLVSSIKSSAGNVISQIGGIDQSTIDNSKAAFNNILTLPSQITNGLASSIGSALGIGNNDTADANANVAPEQLAGTAYNAVNYGQVNANGSTSVTSQGTGIVSQILPTDPIYANTNTITSGITNRQDADSYKSIKADIKSNIYDNSCPTPSLYTKTNGINVDELAKKPPNANINTGKRSLMAFLKHIDNFGVLLLNNFEIYFTGLPSLTMFVMNFDLGGSKQNTTDIYYDGIKVTIPVNYEHEHEFSMTMMNDANGYIYSAIKSYIELDSYNHKVDPGTSLLVRVYTGQIPENIYSGARIYCRGVRLTGMSGLSYGQDSNSILTFTVNGTLIEYSHLPTNLSKYT